MQAVKFRLSGSCKFFDTTQPLSKVPKSTRLTGLWHWTFANGIAGTTYINGASTIRVSAYDTTILGVIRINMAEIDESATDRQILFLSYKSAAVQEEGDCLKITIKGDFTGGVGQYKDAEGTLTLVVVNSIITEGFGQLILQ